MKYIKNIMSATSQFVNALLLGDPDESVSGRVWRAVLSDKPKWFVVPMHYVIDTVAWFFGDKNHSLTSLDLDEIKNEREIWSWIKEGK